jgi:hypothetical protein
VPSPHVSVRLAAALVAVAAAAGCMSVGEDAQGGSARPAHSAGERGDDATGGGPAAPGREQGRDDGTGDAKHGHGGRGKKGERPAPPSGSPSAGASPPAAPGVRTGPTAPPGMPSPTKQDPTPPATSDPQPPPPQDPSPPPPPSPDAEPSSSAHEGTGTGTQLAQREPAPEAGAPA